MKWIIVFATILCGPPAMADTYRVFGDSIAEGSGATSPATTGWAAQLASSLSLTYNEFAYGGDMAGDITRRGLYSQTMAAGDISAVYVGTNDQRFYGNDNPTKMGYYIESLRNALVWLATTSKIKAMDIGGETGSWGNTALHGIGRSTTSAGSTKTFTNTGTVAYLTVIGVDNGYGGSFEILKNGTSIGTFSSQAPGCSTIPQPPGKPTYPYTAKNIRIPNLTPGDTITYRHISGYGYVEWFADNNQAVKPRVLVGNIIRAAAGYQWGGSDANVAAYNAALASMVAELVADGLDIVLVDVHAALNNTTDLHPADGLHPSQQGHDKMAAAYIDAAQGEQEPPPPPPAETFETAPVYRRKINGVQDGTFWIDDGAERKQITTVP